MRIIKLTKKDLKAGWEHILNKAGLVHENRGYPGNLYMSKADIKDVRQEYIKRFKKGGRNARLVKYSEGMHFLNLGANSLLENVIKPGYALVDDTKTT
jgi:hypothetical protein